MFEIFLFWLVGAAVVAIAAAARGRSGFGWLLLSLVLSPLIGLILVLVLPRRGAEAPPSPATHVKCPDCAELIRKEARVCRHCGCRLVPQE